MPLLTATDGKVTIELDHDESERLRDELDHVAKRNHQSAIDQNGCPAANDPLHEKMVQLHVALSLYHKNLVLGKDQSTKIEHVVRVYRASKDGIQGPLALARVFSDGARAQDFYERAIHAHGQKVRRGKAPAYIIVLAIQDSRDWVDRMFTVILTKFVDGK